MSKALLIGNALHLRLPAFGRELLDLRRRGLVPGRTVVVSLDSWKWGRGYPQLVVTDDLDDKDISEAEIVEREML